MDMDPEFEVALKAFSRRLPACVAGLRQIVGAAHGQCAAFDAASSACLDALLAYLREENRREDRFSVFPPHIQTWDPELDAARLDELIIQYALLERLFRCAFPDALKCNALVGEIDRVLDALGACGFERRAGLAPLEESYQVVERAFRACAYSAEQQQVLSTFCERFVNAYDPGQARQYSVIYTPQEIVQFMVESQEEELRRAFGRSLSSPHTAILDPCTGIGSFIIYALRRIGREVLSYKYRHEIFAIEIMLLPYLIALLNIEQAHVDLLGWYAPFPGLRYADALG